MASLTHSYPNPPPPPPPPGAPPPPPHRLPPPPPGPYPSHGQAYPSQAYPPAYGQQQPYPPQPPYPYPALPGPPQGLPGLPPGNPPGGLPAPLPPVPGHGGPHPPHSSMHSQTLARTSGANPNPPSYPPAPMQNPSLALAPPTSGGGGNLSAANPSAGKAGGNLALPGGTTRRAETEEERRERKRREMEKRKHQERKRAEHARQQQQHKGEGGHKHGASGLMTSGARPSYKDPRYDKQRQAGVPVGASEGKPENRLKRPTNFICRTRFTNELPPPVFAPKWLTINQDRDRYTKYAITSLERGYKHRLHVEPDLGIPLDLLDISAYTAPPPAERPPLDPRDAELLREDLASLPRKKDSIKIKERPTDKGLNWLVHTQYIAPTDRDDSLKKPARSEKEAKLLALQLELEQEGDLTNDREAQIRAIEDTFRAAAERPVHSTNPSLQPLEILPILPNLDRMGDQYVQLVFDTDPMEDSLRHRDLAPEAKEHLQARAVMKNFKMPATDTRPEQSFVAYMVPSTNEIDQEHEMEESVVYDWVREYHWTVSKGEAGRSSFLLCVGEDNVTFVPLNTKLTVKKLKAKEGKAREEEEREEFPIPREVTVRKREFSDLEEEMRERTRRRVVEGDEGVEEQQEALRRAEEEERSPAREEAVEAERSSGGAGGEEDSGGGEGGRGGGRGRREEEESGDEGYERERSRSRSLQRDEEEEEEEEERYQRGGGGGQRGGGGGGGGGRGREERDREEYRGQESDPDQDEDQERYHDDEED